jgi:hypothetical protein
MFRGITVFFIIISSFVTIRKGVSQSTSKDMWTTLSMVTFQSSYDPSTMMEVKVPKVSKSVEKLDATGISIEGYIIPLTGQVTQSHFMLSKFPQSTCFFCGKAGPESAMQVFMKDNVKIKISERKVKVKGTLLINPTDITSLLYTLENAEIIE